MRIKIVACRVFSPELEVLSQATGIEFDIDWLPLRAHDHPDLLRSDLQAAIDRAEDSGGEGRYDIIILAYGLCGNAVAGLRAPSLPLLIPKAHDCSHILLGSLEAHQRYFGETPSRGWTSRGYLAEESNPFRTDDSALSWNWDVLVEQLGEENARYVWDTLHRADPHDDPVLYFLDVAETRDTEVLQAAKLKARERGKVLKEIPATLSLLKRLLTGREGEGLLLIPPGATIQPSYDSRVLRSIKVDHGGDA